MDLVRAQEGYDFMFRNCGLQTIRVILLTSWKTTSNGVNSEIVFLQNVTFGPNKAVGIEYDSNLLISSRDFIATFEHGAGPNGEIYVLELASYGVYREQWKLPNMTCVSKPITPFPAYLCLRGAKLTNILLVRHPISNECKRNVQQRHR